MLRCFLIWENASSNYFVIQGIVCPILSKLTLLFSLTCQSVVDGYCTQMIVIVPESRISIKKFDLNGCCKVNFFITGLTQLAQGEEDFFHHLALDK